MESGNSERIEPIAVPDRSLVRELAGPGRPAAAANQSLAEATVPPGGETAEHLHREAEEIYLFTAGAGRMRVGEEERDVASGDFVVIPPGTPHKLWNPSDRESLLLLCCCSPPYSDADTVVTEGN
jgi:mannose-6-phosphate isomerase-like protein (cupin superfamily)